MMHFAPIFVSHGSPMLALDAGESGRFWASLAASLPRPEAVLCVSAHTMTEAPLVGSSPAPETIHDFYGFPAPLYEQRYETEGAPQLARRAAELLGAAGIPCAIDPELGLDHGAWVPLRAMYPQGIPVAPVAIQPRLNAAWHCRVGRALAPLADEGVLVMGSGGAVHNLRIIDRAERMAVPDWARTFDDWLEATLAQGAEAEFLDWQKSAPDACIAHPTPDHFLPIFVAYGAAGPGARGTRLHKGFTLGSMSMAAYRFAQ
jgi:4,5-DOPA dioxygenase extradiol